MFTGDKTGWILLNGHMDGSEFSKKGILWGSDCFAKFLISQEEKSKCTSSPVHFLPGSLTNTYRCAVEPE